LIRLIRAGFVAAGFQLFFAEREMQGIAVRRSTRRPLLNFLPKKDK
jgi:hypothetical protein